MMVIKALIQRLSFTLLIFLFLSLHLTLYAKQAKAKDFGDEDFSGGFRPLVRKDHRKSLVDNEYGQISAVDLTDGIKGPYHIQFITLMPNSLFLPVLLHSDMVFYVHTGSGRLSWADEESIRRVNLRRGDFFRLQLGSVFFIQSDLEPGRESLRIYAIFPNTDDDLFEPAIGAYSSIRNLVRGFDKITLKRAFMASDEVIESITSATETQAIVHGISAKEERKEKEETIWEVEARFLKTFLGCKESIAYNKKKLTRAYNLLDADPDFENCNGWSLTVNRKKASHLLKGTNIGLFMVNVTKGSMMGPHWNPRATEIAIVLHGQGMVRVACSSSSSTTKSKSECKNMRFRVQEGDVFAVPRFHPMAQMSFNNDSLVFMGFSTSKKNNHPQFLAGRESVLQTLDRDVLAMSFNVGNTTIDQLLAPQADSIILDCTSCAEEEERRMEDEIEKEKQEEEARKREEEEARRREEEERRRREEEEERKREEEEARRREEEEERRREEEEERRREEEEARKREEEEEEQEERERQREEGERRQEEERQRQEEEERERRREEEERRQRQEEEREREQEEARKREEESERERQREERREQEDEEAAESEQDEAWRRAEERERRRRQEEGEARKERGRETSSSSWLRTRRAR